MKIRSVTIALTIVLIPFISGVVLFNAKLHGTASERGNFISDTRYENKGIDHKGISIDWSFSPDWRYKPLFFPSKEYLVFVFHYKNDSEYDIELAPSYTFVPPPHRRYSANEEISMYIEDDVEDELGITDETSMSYKISPGATIHYIVTFEKPENLNHFYIDVDIFRDDTLRLYYEKKCGTWVNANNELIDKYRGRG